MSGKWVPGEFPRRKCGRCVRLTTLPPHCAVVIKSGNLNFLEPSGPLQACNGTAAFYQPRNCIPSPSTDDKDGCRPPSKTRWPKTRNILTLSIPPRSDTSSSDRKLFEYWPYVLPAVQQSVGDELCYRFPICGLFRIVLECDHVLMR